MSTVKLKSKSKSKPPNNEIAKKRNKTKQVRQKVVEEDVISHLTIENENYDKMSKKIYTNYMNSKGVMAVPIHSSN